MSLVPGPGSLVGRTTLLAAALTLAAASAAAAQEAPAPPGGLAREEVESALRDLPVTLRQKIEALLRGEKPAAASLTAEEREAVEALPPRIRDRVLAAFPAPRKPPEPEPAKPAGAPAKPAAERPATPPAPARPDPPPARPSRVEELPLFGHDLFARAADFPPASDLPVGSDYVVGPGDRIAVRVWSRTEGLVSLEETVDREGSVAYPKVGPLSVRGLPFGKVEEALREAFGRVYRDATVAVTMGSLRTIPVYVIGDVARPGEHRLAAGARVLHALFAAGGPTERGSLRRVTLRRGAEVRATFDGYRFLSEGIRDGDERLDPGDVVFVPGRGPTAGVTGEVLRPGRYEIGPGATVADLLALAGGHTPLGFRGAVQLERTDEGARRVIRDLQAERLAREPAADGDLVRVLAIEPTPRNRVELRGNIERPGDYEWVEGMRVSGLLDRGGRLLPGTHLGRAEILRETGEERDLGVARGAGPVRTAREVLVLDLGKLLAGDASQDLPLRPLDRLRVFAEHEVRAPFPVSIRGEVGKPGAYEFVPGMRVSDLVFRAGETLPPTAHLDRAELLRLARAPGTDYAYAQESERARASRVVVPVNLGRALRGDPAADLTLAPYDELVVLAETDVRPPPTVVVSGGVQRPGTFELTEGLTARDLVLRAGGILPNAFLDRAEVVRRVFDATRPEGYRLEVIPFHLGRALAGRAPDDPRLENFDHVQVKQVTDYRVTVRVEGEVLHPGDYALPRGARLSDLIVRAGGLGRRAFPDGAFFTRRSVQEVQEAAMKRFVTDQRQRLLRLEAEGPLETLSAEAAGKIRESLRARRSLLEELEKTPVVGRLAIRISGSPEFERSIADIELQDGDSLRIPAVPASVTVQGYVYSPATVIYEPGKRVSFYLDRAGGLRDDADEDAIHVVKPDGSAMPLRSREGRAMRWDWDRFRWIQGRPGPEVGPGDVIVVPPAIQTVSGYDLTRDLVDIVFKIALAAGVVAGIGG